ncbi:MAG: hypothetical protein IT190_07410 [Microbacteriaceae bacterium]|nr:hypothetical protein [Microbacteriaceae bacterium]
MAQTEERKEVNIHHYDDEGFWTVEVYGDDIMNYHARRCKMTPMETVYDGSVWKASSEQMAYFFRIASGEAIRIPKNIQRAETVPPVGRSKRARKEALDSSLTTA